MHPSAPSNDPFPVSLGYIGDPEKPHLLHRRYFPSKVGGRPAWLDPANLPNGDQVLICGKPNCSKQPLTFILQVYAGRDSPADAFHRTVFIFGCQWCSETFVALRCQLPRLNEFYPPTPSDRDDSSTTDECLERRCCPACGVPTERRSLPQVEEVVESKAVDRDSIPLPTDNGHGDSVPEMHHRCKVALEWVDTPIPVVFEEGELEIDEENLDPSKVEPADLSHEKALLERYKMEVQQDPENELDESEVEAFDEIHQDSCHQDATFEKFLEHIRLNPGHVLRYHSEDDLHATPLWFSSHQLPTQQQLDEQVGQCSNCGARRRLEFQIQPNLINDLWRDCRLSFGILAIYTCEASCSPKLDHPVSNEKDGAKNLYGSYIQECVIRQEEKFGLK